MSIDRYSVSYYLTTKGWVEVVKFDGKSGDAVEEWSANCRQASAFSDVEVSWSLTRGANPGDEKTAKALHKKYPKPKDFY